MSWIILHWNCYVYNLFLCFSIWEHGFLQSCRSIKNSCCKKTHTFVAAAAASYSFVNVRPLKEGSKPSCPPSQSINFMQLVFYIHKAHFFSCYEEKPRSNFFFDYHFVLCTMVYDIFSSSFVRFLREDMLSNLHLSF